MVLGRCRVFVLFRVSMLTPGPPKGSLRIEAGDDYEVEARDNATTNTVRCCLFRTLLTHVLYIYTWDLKHPFINGCFKWMIPNLYIENGCFTKHPLKNGCLGFQVYIYILLCV